MNKHLNADRTGAALFTVMGIVFALCIVMGAVIAASSQRTFMARKLGDRTRALVIAEAGASEAYTILSTNFALRTDPAAFPVTAFGGGTYDVTVTPLDDNMALITSTGVCGIAQESVILNVKNFPAGTGSTPPSNIPNWPANVYGFAVVAGGNMSFVGNMDMNTSNGWIHANGSMYGNGVQTIRGNVSSSVSLDFPNITGEGAAPSVSGNIGTQVVGNVPLVTIPDINLTPYYNSASNYGQVFTTGTKSLSGTVSPPGGIMWVNGNIEFGNGTYTGCFIATGNIEMKTTGNGTIENNKVAGYPILVSQNGYILIKQAKTWTFQGLVYCKTGYFDKQGNGDVFGRGTIMAAGNVSKNGGWSGMIYEDSTPVPPGGGGGGEGAEGSTVSVVGMTAWQK